MYVFDFERKDRVYVVMSAEALVRIFIVLSLAMAAIAQTNSRSDVIGGVIGPSPAVVSFSSFGPGLSTIWPGLPGGAVTGAPYSGEEVTERVQTLADGTHITQPPQKTVFYRDSQGRTRIERTISLPPGASIAAAPRIIEISDPVSGARYTLDPRSRTARKLSFPSAPPPPPPGTTVTSQRLAVQAATPLFSPSLPDSQPQSPPTPSGTTVTSQRLAVQAATPAMPPFLPDSQAKRPEFSRESLGTQTIEGVLAEGSRTTVTYPIGAVGNDRPITTVSETWTSPELKTVVLSKNSDPRNGDSTTRLTNISRLEPDPSLFEIPSDYEIVDPQTPGR